MPYAVTKTYGHELGLSACFRQWRAQSHCRFLHGYPLSFKLTFEAVTLDENNWVLDFGGLKQVKSWLVDHFDHRLLVAEDDPERERLQALMPSTPGVMDGVECRIYQIGDPKQLADVLVVPFVGCEGFARYVFDYVVTWLIANHRDAMCERGLCLAEVEVREHGGNSAIYRKETV